MAKRLAKAGAGTPFTGTDSTCCRAFFVPPNNVTIHFYPNKTGKKALTLAGLHGVIAADPVRVTQLETTWTLVNPE